MNDWGFVEGSPPRGLLQVAEYFGKDGTHTICLLFGCWPHSGSVSPNFHLSLTRKRYACAWIYTSSGTGPVMIWRRNLALPNRTKLVIGTLETAPTNVTAPWNWVYMADTNFREWIVRSIVAWVSMVSSMAAPIPHKILKESLGLASISGGVAARHIICNNSVHDGDYHGRGFARQKFNCTKTTHCISSTTKPNLRAHQNEGLEYIIIRTKVAKSNTMHWLLQFSVPHIRVASLSSILVTREFDELR
eukprot:scaffold381_cov178-Amphora_coffeaeformis.AAC.10